MTKVVGKQIIYDRACILCTQSVACNYYLILFVDLDVGVHVCLPYNVWRLCLPVLSKLIVVMFFHQVQPDKLCHR